MSKNILGIALALLMIYSCGPKSILDQKVDIPQPWKYNDLKTFDFEVVDTTVAYDLTIDVAHDADFPHENVYLQVTTTFPDGKKISNPLSLELADDQGGWQGDCNGSRCMTSIAMAQQSYYKKPGKYKMSFEQYTRQDTLNGIHTLQLQITQSK
jgi:gliding motility-associated lipoprotein GldH